MAQYIFNTKLPCCELFSSTRS